MMLIALIFNLGSIMTNEHLRNAKRIIHELHNLLLHVKSNDLPFVGKAYAKQYSIPQKVMLKTMSRYARLHHSK
jgi:hypothetical protein